MKYKVCEECGAHLDSNETCECKERKEISNEVPKKAQAGIAGGIAFVMFFLMLGAVGDMELGKVSMLESVVRIGIRLVLFVMFVYLAGGFEDSEERWNKRKADV